MRLKTYRHTHGRTMATPAVAQMTATMLYGKRFFPYYISNILAGLDKDGKGVVYSYDPVGHTERFDSAIFESYKRKMCLAQLWIQFFPGVDTGQEEVQFLFCSPFLTTRWVRFFLTISSLTLTLGWLEEHGRCRQNPNQHDQGD